MGFATRLLRPPVEAPHIVASSQLGLCFVGQSRHGTELRCVRERISQPSFLRELACTVLEFVRVIPGGVLVFFPSKHTLEAIVGVLREPCRDGRIPEGSLWDWLVSRKGHVAIEGTDGATSLSRHEQAAVENGSAVLFCVYRGRSSEGVSLSDHAARGVVCVGIPLPPLNPAVRLKREYNDALAQTSRTALNGESWYNLGAYRAVNQALGRAVRHRDDFGAIVLIDSRWTAMGSVRAAKYLPHWLRELVGISETARGEALAFPIERLLTELRQHFQRLMHPSRLGAQPLPIAARASTSTDLAADVHVVGSSQTATADADADVIAVSDATNSATMRSTEPSELNISPRRVRPRL